MPATTNSDIVPSREEMKTANQRGMTGSSITKSRWDEFAEADAYTYIMTDLPKGDRRVFWQSGETAVAEELLPCVRRHSVSAGVALEIGCGIGRLMFPMAHTFERVVGLDIAPEMARQGTAMAQERQVENVRFLTVTDYENGSREFIELQGRVDFIYSLLVFQHIAEFHSVQAYFHLIQRLLSNCGIAYLQFDTRKQTALYQLKSSLPDFLLPRYLRRGIRRIRRTPQELLRSFADCDLAIVEDAGAGTEYHRYVLKKRTS